MALRSSLFCDFVGSLSEVSFFGLHVYGGYWCVVFRSVVAFLFLLIVLSAVLTSSQIE